MDSYNYGVLDKLDQRDATLKVKEKRLDENNEQLKAKERAMTGESKELEEKATKMRRDKLRLIISQSTLSQERKSFEQEKKEADEMIVKLREYKGLKALEGIMVHLLKFKTFRGLVKKIGLESKIAQAFSSSTSVDALNSKATLQDNPSPNHEATH